MASTTEYRRDEALGVGSIVGESFSILFKHIIPVTLMALVPMLLGILVSGGLIGTEATLGIADPDLSAPSLGFSLALAVIVQIVFYGLSTALLVQLAYDAKLGRPLQLGRYISPTLRAVVPISILLLIASILTGLGFAALVVPGLWIYAVFSVVAPAVVIEGVGFSGLSRSAQLTKDYRWPIVGALILIGICTGILNFIATFAAGALIDMGIIISSIAYLIVAALGAGLAGISVALIYARLREIKEGVSVDQIASVFD